MSDRSAVQRIKSVTTNQGTYSTGDSWYPNCFEKIIVVEKDPNFTPWYQCWYKGQVMKEINSLHVIDVEYEIIQDEPIPF